MLPSSDRSERNPWTRPSTYRTATGSADGATGRSTTTPRSVAARVFRDIEVEVAKIDLDLPPG
jgi:hypothetical protein